MRGGISLGESIYYDSTLPSFLLVTEQTAASPIARILPNISY